MSTTMETAAVPAQAGPDDAAGEAPASSPEPRGRRVLTLPGYMIPVALIGLAGGLLVAGIGFALSYDTLRHAAAGWGFGRTAAKWFPVGIDGAIVTFFALDLVMAYRGTPKPLLRWAAHVMTLATIALNAGAGHGSVWGHPWRSLSHAAMPIVFVVVVDAVRHAVTRAAELESGAGTLTLREWLLAPWRTFLIFRESAIVPCTITEARAEQRERVIHRVWLAHRAEIEAATADGGAADRVGVLDRLPDLLAPYGVSVEEALALPEQMRRKDQKRHATAEKERLALDHQQAADRRALAHADRMAEAAAEAEALRAEGELAVLRAQTTGAAQAAEHAARAEADTAAVRATARLADAQRAATAAERAAADEEQAEETARAAAARRKTAEDDRAAAAAEHDAAKTRADADAERARAAQARAAEADAQARAAARVVDTAVQTARAEQARQQAAEARAATARAELAAREAEDAAQLSPRERSVRRVARLILAEAGGQPEALPLSRVEAELRVSNGTASGYRAEASELIASGYRADTAWSDDTRTAYPQTHGV